MGIHQDAIDLWDNPNKNAIWTLINQKEDYNTNVKRKMKYLQTINDMGEYVSKKDLKNGFLRKYTELSPCTQIAIKESIFGISDKKYRKKLFKNMGWNY